jgi:signal transduction histidine kinase/CheY-like chemotaxis protein
VILARRAVQRDDNGQPKAFIGVSIDVTDQVSERMARADLALQLDRTVAAVGVGIWSRLLDSPEIKWNAEMYRITGLDPAQAPPDRAGWRAMLHPADLANYEAHIDRVEAQSGVTLEAKFRLVRADGTVRWLEQRSTVEGTAEGRRLSGIALDVTARVHADMAMRSLSDQAALATRSAGIGTWSMDMESGIEEWDEQMFALRGLAVASVVPPREDRRRSIHADDLALFGDGPLPVAVREGRQSMSYEFRVIWPDGRVRWLASRSRVLHGDDGQPVRVVGVNWDISDSKSAALAVQEREAALRQSQAKSELLARVSHELRTPLNAVLGFAQLLDQEIPADAEPQRMKLAHIRGAGEHLLSMINDVLELASVESGTQKLDLQSVAVQDVCFQALPLVEDLARRHQVTISLGAQTGHVLADPTRLRQVLVNLLSNAIKYNRPGGSVVLQSHADGSDLALAVCDNGPGMSAEQQAQLFEPFNRLGADARGIEGTGIGLVIVKALVEAMHGRIRVSSSPTSGTEVSIVLPAAPSSPPATEGRALAASADTGEVATPTDAAHAERVQGDLLYIEDNEVNVLLVAEIVKARTALSLHVAGTGTEGIALARRLQPGLVLVDMQLPDMQGEQVLEALRADPATRSLRCVALSANALKEDIDRALALGFADYWTKPIDFGRFVSDLQAAFTPPARAP